MYVFVELSRQPIKWAGNDIGNGSVIVMTTQHKQIWVLANGGLLPCTSPAVRLTSTSCLLTLIADTCGNLRMVALTWYMFKPVVDTRYIVQNECTGVFSSSAVLKGGALCRYMVISKQLWNTAML